MSSAGSLQPNEGWEHRQQAWWGMSSWLGTVSNPRGCGMESERWARPAWDRWSGRPLGR